MPQTSQHTRLLNECYVLLMWHSESRLHLTRESRFEIASWRKCPLRVGQESIGVPGLRLRAYKGLAFDLLSITMIKYNTSQKKSFHSIEQFT